MSTSTPPPVPPWSTKKQGPSFGKFIAGSFGKLLVIALVIFIPLFIWFGCRIEPRSGEFAVLMRKTGAPLEPEEILATKEGQQGIQLETLAEGRYFKNPYTWGWSYLKVTDIPAGKLGVQTRLHGTDLPGGEIIAREGTKGILAEVLRPGKYRLNPFAVDVQILDAITIKPGHVGVVTHLTGKDVLHDQLLEAERNTFLVSNALKGVVAEVLDPGTHYLNPYMFDVREVSLQSQRFAMGGEEQINFLTLDAFDITVEGTIEYAIDRDHAALITHRIGDIDDVLKKIIMPRARGFMRLEGSKYPANNFIVGETRQLFQDNLEKHLREKCEDWGVQIKSVLIRNIAPPDQIASVIREREVAVQNSKKFEQQIEQAKSKAELTKQEMLAEQNKGLVEQQTISIKALIKAQQEQMVALTVSSQELAVARFEAQAATFDAASQIAKAQAERDVVKLDNEAQAAVLASQVNAFGDGAGYARYILYQTLAPRVQSILTSDDKDGLGGIFVPARPQTKGGQP